MLMATVNQGYLFLACVYGGILIGILYDANRLIRYFLKTGVLLTGLVDLIFWLGAGAIAAYCLFAISLGFIAFYQFLGFVLGCIIYLAGLSDYIRQGVFRIIKGLQAIKTKLLAIKFVKKRLQ